MQLERLGKYELQERLGRGGMGEVWKARDMELRRYVAIKLLHADLQANPDFVTHFMREAQFVASLRHPNIVQIHDFQLTNTQGTGTAAYMVMDYVEGGTLADYIRNTSRKGLFPAAAEIVYLFTAISLALDYAHQKEMIHRDIKPANILIDKHTTRGKFVGEPILTDFGIARLQKAGTGTLTQAMLGTPLYVSPEQAGGLAIDARSDLYSLGIILYEIVTGVTPFRGDNPLAIMMQHLNEMPTPPALINPNIPPELSAVVLKSIAKDPEARFPTASAMTVALAKGLNIQVPASLGKPRTMNEQPEYNPLQPARSLSDMAPHLSSLTASPPAGFTPASAGYPEAQFIWPAHLTPATNDYRGDNPNAGTAEPRSPAGSDLLDHPVQPPLVSPLPPVQPRRRRLYIALIACVILLLVGITAFSVLPLLFPKNTTTNTSGKVVGHIVFVRSPNAPQNTFDQLQIDLTNISPPQPNKIYYAWLENPNSEAKQDPHWQLQISNGAVHTSFTWGAKYTDLLAQNNRFLITEEDAGSTPVIPIPDPRVYYATISQSSSSSPTFDVKQCPPSNTNNDPCH